MATRREKLFKHKLLPAWVPVLAAGLMLSGSAFGQYKVESAGAPPSDLPAAISGVLQKEGYKVMGGKDKVICEVWLVGKAPAGPESAEPAVDLPKIPQGSFLGVVRFPQKGSDRRGQQIQPGVYTLRYAWYPVNGAHQGIAPQRDFAVMSPVGLDQDPSKVFSFEELMPMSMKASGTPHPAVWSIWRSRHEKFPELTPEGDFDQVLHLKMGDTALAIIVVGVAEG